MNCCFIYYLFLHKQYFVLGSLLSCFCVAFPLYINIVVQLYINIVVHSHIAEFKMSMLPPAGYIWKSNITLNRCAAPAYVLTSTVSGSGSFSPVVQSKKTIAQTNIRISFISTSQMSGGTLLENANPLIFQRTGERLQTANDEDEDVADPIDDREIFDILSV